MKLCVDCKYCISYDVLRCMKIPLSISPVTGNSIGRYRLCEDERSYDSLYVAIHSMMGHQVCGKSGRFWEPKE